MGVVERAGKFSRLAYAYNIEQERKIAEMSRWLAMAGRYHHYSTHREAYPDFVDHMMDIFMDSSRAKIYGEETGGGGAGGGNLQKPKPMPTKPVEETGKTK